MTMVWGLHMHARQIGQILQVESNRFWLAACKVLSTFKTRMQPLTCTPLLVRQLRAPSARAAQVLSSSLLPLELGKTAASSQDSLITLEPCILRMNCS